MQVTESKCHPKSQDVTTTLKSGRDTGRDSGIRNMHSRNANALVYQS